MEVRIIRTNFIHIIVFAAIFLLMSINGLAEPSKPCRMLPSETQTVLETTQESPLPQINTVIPPLGRAGETLYVIISGVNMVGVTSVDFGSGTDVHNLYTSDDELVVNLEIHESASPGFRDITLTTPDHELVYSHGFEILPPQVPKPPSIDTIYPDHGYQGDENFTAEISGENLSGIETVIIVDFSVNIESVDETSVEITFDIPPTTPVGNYDVTVGWFDGETSLPGAFEIRPAEMHVESVTPTRGMRGETIDLVILGSGLQGVKTLDMGPDIEIGPLNVSPSEIQAEIFVIGPASIGVVDLTISGPGGEIILPNIFEILPGLPLIESINPSEGKRGETDLSITITGRNLDTLTGFEVSGDGVSVGSAGYINTTEAHVTFNIESGADLGFRDITVQNPMGEFTFPDGFTVVPGEPQVTNIFPSQGTQGDYGLRIIINGENLDTVTEIDFGDGITLLASDPISVFNYAADIAIDETASPGFRDVIIRTESGDVVSLPDGFEVSEKYIPPDIPDTPDIPDEPVIPDIPDIPDNPDVPDITEIPLLPSFSLSSECFQWSFEVEPGKIETHEHTFDFTLINTGEIRLTDLDFSAANFDSLNGNDPIPSEFFNVTVSADTLDVDGAINISVGVMIPAYGDLLTFVDADSWSPVLLVRDIESGISTSRVMEISYTSAGQAPLETPSTSDRIYSSDLLYFDPSGGFIDGVSDTHTEVVMHRDLAGRITSETTLDLVIIDLTAGPILTVSVVVVDLQFSDIDLPRNYGPAVGLDISVARTDETSDSISGADFELLVWNGDSIIGRTILPDATDGELMVTVSIFDISTTFNLDVLLP